MIDKVALTTFLLFYGAFCLLVFSEMTLTVEDRALRAKRNCCKNDICKIDSVCFAYFRNLLSMKCLITIASMNDLISKRCTSSLNHETGRFDTFCPYEKLIECP